MPRIEIIGGQPREVWSQAEIDADRKRLASAVCAIPSGGNVRVTFGDMLTGGFLGRAVVTGTMIECRGAAAVVRVRRPGRKRAQKYVVPIRMLSPVSSEPE